MLDLLEQVWGTRKITVMDPMAGGGSIPFEALRYGFTVLANELNPVASVILQATLDYPARFGPSLADDIRKWGDAWSRRVEEQLSDFFPHQQGESIFAYLWARTVACPTTGKPVPLSPNWWLSKKEEPVAMRLLIAPAWDKPGFEIVRGDEIDFNPDEGTVSRGVGRSPWTGEVVDGDYIKREAQAGRMGQVLYAVAIKQPGGIDFRVPAQEDLAAVRHAESNLAQNLARWQVAGLIPSEEIGVSNYDRGHRLYGIYRWDDFFLPRQLLSQVTSLEILRDVGIEMRQEMDEDRAGAVETYLGIVMDKAAIYNNRACRFDPSRGIRSIFDRHNYALVWSHAEFDASANLLPWAVNQVVDAYKELAKLTRSAQLPLWGSNGSLSCTQN
jgi:putative DNA methylase